MTLRTRSSVRRAFFCVAVPDPPVQAFDFRDDHGLCLHPTRRVGRQSTGCLLRVQQPHGNVEPIGDRRLLVTGLGQYRPKAGAPSVNAVTSVSAARPTVSRLRRISVAIFVSVFATAPNTCRPPPDVSTLPTRTSRCRSPS
jgi:hypothetical protein